MFFARLFICALWSPAGKGLTSWLSFVVSTVSLSLSHWYPGSGVVLNCIDSWSLHPYLLWNYAIHYGHVQVQKGGFSIKGICLIQLKFNSTSLIIVRKTQHEIVCIKTKQKQICNKRGTFSTHWNTYRFGTSNKHLSHPQWLRPLSFLRRLFCCCWFIVYCCSHCLWGFCVWFLFCYSVLCVPLVLQSSWWVRESWLL